MSSLGVIRPSVPEPPEASSRPVALRRATFWCVVCGAVGYADSGWCDSCDSEDSILSVEDEWEKALGFDNPEDGEKTLLEELAYLLDETSPEALEKLVELLKETR